MEYKCQYCKVKPYKTQRGFDNHMKSKHADVKEMPQEVKIDTLKRFCKYFYDQMRIMGKTNDVAKKILLELILLRRLSDARESYGLNEEELEIVKFNNLANIKEIAGDVDVDRKIIIAIRTYSNHPKLCEYFKNKQSSVYSEIKPAILSDFIRKLEVVDLNISDDFIGDIYEQSITNSSRLMGQFFTPTILKEVALSNIEIKEGYSVFDPCMGSGGFLVSIGEKHKNVQLFGYELDDNVYNIALLNVLIRLNLFSDNFKRCNSFEECTKEEYANRFDVIITNPPYGAKLDVIKDSPIFVTNSKNLDLMFIQLYIYMLKDEGQCCVIMPSGFLTTSTKAFMDIRRLLLTSCTVKKVYVDNLKGSFKNTSVQTCTIYFIKRKSKPTDIVEFYEINNDGVKFLVSASINEIVEKKYTLYYARYVKQEGVVQKVYEYLSMRDVYEKQPPKLVETNECIYNVYGAGGIKGKSANYNYNGFCCKLSNAGISENNCIMVLFEEFLLSSDAYIIKSKNPLISDYYLKVWCWANREKIYNCARGIAQKHVDFEMFGDLQIPVIENQPQFKLDTFEFMRMYFTHDQKIADIQKIRSAYLVVVEKKFKALGELKKLGDLIEIVKGPTHNTAQIDKSNIKTQEYKYRYYTGSEKEEFYTKFYDYKDKLVILNKLCRPILNIGKKFTSYDENYIFKTEVHEFIHLWCIMNTEMLSNKFKGAIHKRLSLDSLLDCEVYFYKDYMKFYQIIMKYDAQLKLLEDEKERIRFYLQCLIENY